MEQAQNKSIFDLRMILRIVLMVAILLAIIFWPAGTFNWPEAWIFLALYLFFTFGGSLWLKKNNPGLLEERINARKKDNIKTWDKIILNAFSLVVTGLFILAGLDAVRFKWSHVPLIFKVIAFLALFPAAFWIAWTFRENSFLSEVVRIQEERGHKVCDTGPYRYIRHPMYVGIFIFLISIPIALGSLYSFIPALIAILLLLIRTAREDKTLQTELEGYCEYSLKVRYKIIPGVW